MSSSDDNDLAKLLANVTMLVISLAGSWTYNKFATTNKEITNHTIAEKYITKHFVSYKSGKRTKFRVVDRFHMKDKNGCDIGDEKSIWNGKYKEGQIYAKVEKGKTYDFYVNHDDLLNKDNALKFKLAGIPQYDPIGLYNTIEKYNPVEKPRAPVAALA